MQILDCAPFSSLIQLLLDAEFLLGCTTEYRKNIGKACERNKCREWRKEKVYE